MSLVSTHFQHLCLAETEEIHLHQDDRQYRWLYSVKAGFPDSLRPVSYTHLQEFLSRSDSVEALVDRVKKLVLRDLKREYPDVDYFDDTDLVESMQDIYETEKCPFVVIIDEWDCIFREFRQNKEAQEKYLDFLRDLLKDKACIHLAYMTGILPIKKYGTHSALNMFDEFSMINPGPLAPVAYTHL